MPRGHEPGVGSQPDFVPKVVPPPAEPPAEDADDEPPQEVWMAARERWLLDRAAMVEALPPKKISDF
jgi:hypothetical protein